MTYKEKFIQELFNQSNERRDEMLDVILELVCPANFAYENDFYCESNGSLIKGKCEKCWNREIK